MNKIPLIALLAHEWKIGTRIKEMLTPNHMIGQKATGPEIGDVTN